MEDKDKQVGIVHNICDKKAYDFTATVREELVELVRKFMKDKGLYKPHNKSEVFKMVYELLINGFQETGNYGQHSLTNIRNLMVYEQYYRAMALKLENQIEDWIEEKKIYRGELEE